MASQPTVLLRRKRVFKPRSTTGCKTCRIRRIKCDETEPSCGQCVRGSRTCDGYVKPLLKRDACESGPTALAAHIDIVVGSPQERLVFDYFRYRTVPALFGSSGSPLWDQLLLQATYHQPAIWHAVVALGSLHWRFETLHSHENEDDSGFALEQYLKAIAYLLVPTKERRMPAADVALISCILFTGFELLRGHYKTALSHINGGVNIILELQSGHPNTTLSLSPSPHIPLNVLRQIFCSLDAQASQILIRRPRYLLNRSTSETSSNCYTTIPASFHSLLESHNMLDDIRTCAMKALQSLPPPRPIADPRFPMVPETKVSLDLIRSSSAIRLRQWSSAFLRFCHEKRAELSETDSKNIQLLKLHRIMAELNFNIDFARATIDEMMWDEYFDKFEAMIGYAESFLKQEEGEVLSGFTFDNEVILPLYFVAVKCRHGRVRRTAISLLRSQERQEGVWNSILTARVAEYLIRIEEEDIDGAAVSAADVVRRKRVLGVEVNFDLDERRASVSYVKLKEGGGVKKVNKWVEWDSAE